MDRSHKSEMSQSVAVVTFWPPALIEVASAQVQTRFAELFVNTIRNENTRRAYSRAVSAFLAWCEDQGVASIADVQPLHVGTYIEALTGDPAVSAPTIKLRLAAIRRLFDWLVMGTVEMVVNPAASVR